MSKKMIKFTDIGQFRNVVYNVNRAAEFDGMDESGEPIINVNNPKPVIKFRGTVKLHGTNASVGWNGSELWAQSRERIISVDDDNAGFAFFIESNKSALSNLMMRIKSVYNISDDKTIVVYGEWCGDGIQKGVGVNEIPKMFVIFKIKIANPGDGELNTWLKYNYLDLSSSDLMDIRVSFIEGYETYEIDIDFNKPEESQNRLIELTAMVEKECPVAKAHGVNSGLGEGIVWTGTFKGNDYIFKIKGEKHSVTKVKKLANIDIEKLNTINEFVEYAVTENRLDQGVEVLFSSPGIEITKQGIPSFLRWVQGDVMKEETDTLVKNKLEPKDVNGVISKKAVKWFMAKYGI